MQLRMGPDSMEHSFSRILQCCYAILKTRKHWDQRKGGWHQWARAVKQEYQQRKPQIAALAAKWCIIKEFAGSCTPRRWQQPQRSARW